ncbi:MAG: carbohydrate kinase family protein [Anaerolineales bacterium]|nr:carbohydrate kinase family protein [Anaerolineales bacterium]
MPHMDNLLIIGHTSLDDLHLGNHRESTIGGAGLYTALAAWRAGAAITLFAPKPEPLPEPLQAVAARVNWIGPRISPEELTRLEIVQHGGGRATLLNAHWGAEAKFTPEHLPPDLSSFALVHIAALSSAQRQLEFLHAARARGAQRISVGTYARVVYGETATVRQLIQEADVFFMNENEARGILDEAEAAHTEKLLYVTLGERGAWVIEAARRTHLPALMTNEVDATGAGDTFCGATLARLAAGASPVEAAHAGIALAAQTISAPGPQALLRSKQQVDADNADFYPRS